MSVRASPQHRRAGASSAPAENCAESYFTRQPRNGSHAPARPLSLLNSPGEMLGDCGAPARRILDMILAGQAPAIFGSKDHRLTH